MLFASARIFRAYHEKSKTEKETTEGQKYCLFDYSLLFMDTRWPAYTFCIISGDGPSNFKF